MPLYYTLLLPTYVHLAVDTKMPNNELEPLNSRHPKTPEFHTSQASDLVHYPQQVAAASALFTRPLLATVMHSPLLQESVAVRLAFYLHNDFANKLSAFMSYPNTLLVQKILKQQGNAELFIKHCLKTVDKNSELCVSFLLAELKRFFKLAHLTLLTEDIRAADASLSAAKRIADNHNDLAVDKLLALLASFIKEDKKKHYFLAKERNKEAAIDFILRNSTLFASFEQQEEATLIAKVRIVLNQLMPTREAYLSTELHHPFFYAQQVENELEEAIQQKILAAFLCSAEFYNALKTLLNAENYQAVLAILSKDKNIHALVLQLRAAKDEGFNKEVFLRTLKYLYPSLATVQFLAQPMQDCKDFFTTVPQMVQQEPAVIPPAAPLALALPAQRFSRWRELKDALFKGGQYIGRGIVALYYSCVNAINHLLNSVIRLCKVSEPIHERMDGNESLTPLDYGKTLTALGTRSEGQVKEIMPRPDYLAPKGSLAHRFFSEHLTRSDEQEAAAPSTMILK